MRRLSTAQHDRAAGVILAQACGDALGVPYEFARPPAAGELAEMKGGGLGNFAPGEWSDDTSMAVPIAQVAATGTDLASAEALDAIAEGFVRWYDDEPADIGNQTSAVLGSVSRRLASGERGPGRIATEEAAAYAEQHPHSAGNGALMRTSPVGLAHLDDRERCAAAARTVASLTHADPLAGDSCVLWAEAIRVAILEGRFELIAGLDLLPEDRRDQWQAWILEAETRPPSTFNPNGFTVHALQAAWSAISSTPVPADDPASASFACLHLQDALHAAVRIGNDTDTVAAIAGGLLGARWGASAVPWRWRRAVHGWPGKDGRDLVELASLAVKGGCADGKGWPSAEVVDYWEDVSDVVVPHPHDPGVLLGTHATHDHDATAVVSACRVGRKQPCFGDAEVVVESRLMDQPVDDPAKNPNLAFTLYDAADAVRGLRREGHTVLLHCVAAQQRTPSIAVAYSRLLGVDAEKAREDVRSALASTRAGCCLERGRTSDGGGRVQHRERVADLWDEVIGLWAPGQDTWPAPLDRWRESYRGRGSGVVDLGQYPDPWVGDLRGDQVEPRLVVLGLNPGVGYDRLQGADGTWTQRVVRESYSRCLKRSPAEDPESWLPVHGKPSPYWRNLVRFAQRWLEDDSASHADVLNFELYPWHSPKLTAGISSPPDIVQELVLAPIAEVEVDDAFAFGAPWFKVAERLDLPVMARWEAGAAWPDAFGGWRVAVHRLASGQRLIVSSQPGYSGPPGRERLEALRSRLDELDQT